MTLRKAVWTCVIVICCVKSRLFCASEVQRVDYHRSRYTPQSCRTVKSVSSLELNREDMASNEEKHLDGVEIGGLEYISDEKWVPTSTIHDPPIVKVTEPSGSFCQVESRFAVSLPPDDVFDIITDANNRRVFKNVKEVTYRKILEDDGNRQLVEVEQLGRWKFLVFSGTFACRVFVEQNRKERSMHYDLSRQGMMKKFQGTWKIEPKYDDEAGVSSSNTGEKSISQGSRLIGSWVNLQQTVQPALIPPWPLTKYVRGVCGQIIQDVCADLQQEAMRLAELKGKSRSVTES